MHRVLRWFVWTLVLAALPFGAAVFMRPVFGQSVPSFIELMGTGQLLLPCLGVLAGPLRELGATKKAKHPELRGYVLLGGVVVAVLVGLAYGGEFAALHLTTVGSKTVLATSQSQQTFIAVASVVVFGLSVLIGWGALAVAVEDNS